METICYYTEWPTGQFSAASDQEALRKTNALVVYRESNTDDGTPFVMVRQEVLSKTAKLFNTSTLMGRGWVQTRSFQIVQVTFSGKDREFYFVHQPAHKNSGKIVFLNKKQAAQLFDQVGLYLEEVQQWLRIRGEVRRNYTSFPQVHRGCWGD